VVSALVLINVVNRHWARLLLGWMTVCRRAHHLGNVTSHLVNSAFHPSGVGNLPRRDGRSTGLSGWG